MSKSNLSKDNWIERSNVLNEMRTPLNLTEMRLLLVYQSKINPRNVNTAKVTFSIEDFQKIMEIQKINTTELKKNMKRIAQRVIEVPYKNGIQYIPLYQRCALYQDDNGEWLIDIECNIEMLPYMFEIKSHYFKYRLWNAIRLTSLNQIRLYEILKQYEKIKKKKIDLIELKLMLGLNEKKYPEYRDFKRYVLDVCQKALEENTDIKYTYIPIKGPKGKVLAIEFTIEKNQNYKDNLKLEDFINVDDIELDEPTEVADAIIVEPSNKPYELDYYSNLCARCNHEYTYKEIKYIYTLAEQFGITGDIGAYIIDLYLRVKSSNKRINNIYRYTIKSLETELTGN